MSVETYQTARPRWPLAAFLAAAVLVTVQKGLVTGHAGNFMLFRLTAHRLLSGVDLYHPPAGEMTGFLYSPTFALLFLPFAIWPFAIGLLLWNGVNALALYAGITLTLHRREAALACAIVFLDLVRNLQNSQSNALVAGLVLLGFVALERRREGPAAVTVLTGAAIKIFPLAAGVLGLLYPRRGRFVLWCLMTGGVLAALPLLVLTPSAFLAVYRDWFGILLRDVGLRGQSVMLILSDWFGLGMANWTVQLAGTGLLVAPLIARRETWGVPAFRRLGLASLLIYMVIFNHQAESPSFVIATAGVAIWYVGTPRRWWQTALLALTILAVSIPELFFFPYRIYHDVVRAHGLNVIPCLLIWVVIQAELWAWPSKERHKPPP